MTYMQLNYLFRKLELKVGLAFIMFGFTSKSTSRIDESSWKTVPLYQDGNFGLEFVQHKNCVVESASSKKGKCESSQEEKAG